MLCYGSPSKSIQSLYYWPSPHLHLFPLVPWLLRMFSPPFQRPISPLPQAKVCVLSWVTWPTETPSSWAPTPTSSAYQVYCQTRTVFCLRRILPAAIKVKTFPLLWTCASPGNNTCVLEKCFCDPQVKETVWWSGHPSWYAHNKPSHLKHTARAPHQRAMMMTASGLLREKVSVQKRGMKYTAFDSLARSNLKEGIPCIFSGQSPVNMISDGVEVRVGGGSSKLKDSQGHSTLALLL